MSDQLIVFDQLFTESIGQTLPPTRHAVTPRRRRKSGARRPRRFAHSAPARETRARFDFAAAMQSQAALQAALSRAMREGDLKEAVGGRRLPMFAARRALTRAERRSPSAATTWASS